MNAKHGSAPLARSPTKAADTTTASDWSDGTAFVTRGADELRAQVAVRRARGPNVRPKKIAVTVRFSPEVIEHFRSSGDGWQTRMDDALRAYVGARSR